MKHLKVYLDDTRVQPAGWVLVKTPQQCIELLKLGSVLSLSLDHDLGDDKGIGTGYDVLLWLEEQVAVNEFVPPELNIHSANISARKRMEQAIDKIYIFAGDRINPLNRINSDV
jgi:hypothetical protein